MFSPTKKKSHPKRVNSFTHILNISGVGQTLQEWGRPSVLHSSWSWIRTLEAGDGVSFTRVKLWPSPGPGSLQVCDGQALWEMCWGPKCLQQWRAPSSRWVKASVIPQGTSYSSSRWIRKSSLFLGRSRKDMVNECVWTCKPSFLNSKKSPNFLCWKVLGGNCSQGKEAFLGKSEEDTETSPAGFQASGWLGWGWEACVSKWPYF